MSVGSSDRGGVVWRWFGRCFYAPDEFAILVAFCEDAGKAWLAI